MPRSRSHTAIRCPGRGQPGTLSKLNRVTQSEVCSPMSAIMPEPTMTARATETTVAETL